VRLDAARLAQFNQTGASSGSSGASVVDGQLRDRPIRPSEMKDEGYVLRHIHPVSTVLYGKGGVCPHYPVVLSTKECVSYLAVVSTRTNLSCSTCVYPMLWRAWTASCITYCVDHLLFHILLPRCQNLLLFSAMSLCYAYAYAYAYTPLCICPPLSLISIAVLCATSLQQDVCRRLILGYNRWYFISLTLPPFNNVIGYFANFLNVWWRV
jgi:hypothetical protein